MNRREFLAASSSLAAPAAPGSRFVKGICNIIFPPGVPLAECFRRAKDAGFDGIEIRIGSEITLQSTPDEMKRLADAARAARVEVISLWASDPLSANPLNSPDPAARARGVEAVKKVLELARLLNCGSILIVPGRLGSGAKFNVGYQDSWDRITAEFHKLVPFAEKAKVVLAPENVWNKFLVSPLEMRAFVDQFRSPWVRTYFDTGNVMQFGYPQDWILTLGPRIKGVHAKDYKLSARSEQGRFVDLLEGDVDWKEVMAALVKIGYHGYVAPEISYDAQDPGQLMKVSRALDKILSLA